MVAVRAAKTIYVRFDLNDYSIPPEAVGRQLMLVGSDTMVRILDGTAEIARHARSYDRHQRRPRRSFGVMIGLIRNPAVRMRKLILSNSQSPGDIVMLTAAVRDLHRCYPGQFEIDVRTPCPQLWENNPYLTRLEAGQSGVEVVECQYPLIHSSNQRPYHFIHGFIDFLNGRLGLRVQPTAFKGDIHISQLEKSWFSQIEEITGSPVPFWIVVAGGKSDFTIKWWDTQRYQRVVDHFRGRILFVQVGERGHLHPALQGVIDLRGKTDLRQLVRLVYHSQGVLCPVTLLMHLAAAVEVAGSSSNRPCVVVAGGREPPHWEAYPHHQFLHTVGALRCCDNGGCWKSRTFQLGDGDSKDRTESLCVDTIGTLPRCMDMISAELVIQAIEHYFRGGAIRYLSPSQARTAETACDGMLLAGRCDPSPATINHRPFKISPQTV
jgi:ADP-heptose:LPS heptosyltransferase